MIEESRTARFEARLKPTLRAAIEADRQAKGQPLVEWFERAVRIALAVSDEKRTHGEG